jgi:hypothetical protein
VFYCPIEAERGYALTKRFDSDSAYEKDINDKQDLSHVLFTQTQINSARLSSSEVKNPI